MSHKRNEALRHVQHSMHHVIAAGEGSDRAPDSCKLCPYYRPDFKFRTCLYAHCPYKKQVNVFRSTPEKWDIMEQNENTLSVLKIAPGQYPQQVEIDNDLKALQQAVGGSIGASYPFEDSVAIVYNDDGKLMGLPLNRALWDEDGLMYDVIAGTFLVVGLGEEDFVSLSPELAQKYEEEFHQPEAFLPLGRRLMVIPVPDESVQNDAEKAVNKPPVEHDR